MSTRAEFFQSMYPGLSDGEVIDELIKASIYGFEHGPEVVTISAAEGIHYVPYDAEMQKKLPYYGGAYEACNIPFTDFQIRYQPEQIRIVDGKRILEDVSNGMDNHETARLSFLTMNWEKAPFGRSDYLEFEVLPPKPTKFDEMVKIAKSLSGGHPFLRVDLYEINNKVYFSELTFSPCGGFMPFVPEEWDAKLGEMVNIRKVK